MKPNKVVWHILLIITIVAVVSLNELDAGAGMCSFVPLTLLAGWFMTKAF